MPTSNIIHQLSQDPVLARIIPDIELPTINPNPDVFNALVKSVVSQQLSTKAAATIYQRFLLLFEQGHATPQEILALDPEVLRATGFSRQKSSYVMEIARFFSEGATSYDWHSMPDQDIVHELTQIKGIGVWTVQMILIFHLGRPDVFPIDDLGIQQSMANLYQLPADKRHLKAQMERVAAQWQPWRSYASRYLWKWRDNLSTVSK